jgi:hypothetical protein
LFNQLKSGQDPDPAATFLERLMLLERNQQGPSRAGWAHFAQQAIEQGSTPHLAEVTTSPLVQTVKTALDRRALLAVAHPVTDPEDAVSQPETPNGPPGQRNRTKM